MDYLEKRIVEVNRYLRVRPGEELTLPNELARKNAKAGYYSKVFKDIEDETNETDDEKEQDLQEPIDTENIENDNPDVTKNNEEEIENDIQS